MGNLSSRLSTCLPSISSTTTLSTEELDQTSIDIYHNHLFEYLDIDDLCNLKLVSKQFYSLVKSYDIIELSILDDSLPDRSDHNVCSIKDNWYSTTKIAKLTNLVYRPNVSMLDQSDNLLNLRFLRINFNHLRIRFMKLNKFTRLEILDVKTLDLNDLSNTNDLLHLSDLKALSIDFGDCYLPANSTSSLVIDTPNLLCLAIQERSSMINNSIIINHPLSIRSLKLRKFDKNTTIFKKLEYFELDNHNELEAADLLTFDCLKKLRILSCTNAFDKLNDLFASMNSELILNGVKVKDANKIAEYKNYTKYNNVHNKEFGFQLDNYDDLEDDLNFVNVLNADLVYLLFNGSVSNRLVNNLPADLFVKYTNIQELRIRSKINEIQLISFISGCSNLDSLKIYESSISQQFYDHLPTITMLTLLRINVKKEVNLNYDFIKKMPYLKYLFADQYVPISDNLSSSNLKTFKFKIKDQLIDITKHSQDRYSVKDRKALGLPDREYFKLNELIQWSNSLTNDKKPKRRSMIWRCLYAVRRLKIYKL